MTLKERQTLFKLHEAVVKLLQPPPATFTPQTGEVAKAQNIVSSTLPQPLPPAPKYNG